MLSRYRLAPLISEPNYTDYVAPAKRKRGRPRIVGAIVGTGRGVGVPRARMIKTRRFRGIGVQKATMIKPKVNYDTDFVKFRKKPKAKPKKKPAKAKAKAKAKPMTQAQKNKRNKAARNRYWKKKLCK